MELNNAETTRHYSALELYFFCKINLQSKRLVKYRIKV